MKFKHNIRSIDFEKTVPTYILIDIYNEPSDARPKRVSLPLPSS